MNRSQRRIARWVLWTAVAFMGTYAQAVPYTGLVVFGDSLSDAGNNAIVFDGLGLAQTPSLPPGTLRTPAPVPGQDFIPTFPYASNHYSNGAVWVETVALALGLPAIKPSLAGGTDFAFGGARTGPSGSSFPFSLRDQVTQFLNATGGVAPASNLYIVAGGGNDARDALQGNPADIPGAIAQYVANELTMLSALIAAGARDIMLVTVPDIGKTPAVRAAGALAAAAGTQIAAAMNAALDSALNNVLLPPGTHILELDAFALVNAVNNDPAAFGITDSSSACAASLACIASPSTTFFWDGIHPTAAGHALIAHAALALIPEAPTLWLLVLGVLGCALQRRSRAARQA